MNKNFQSIDANITPGEKWRRQVLQRMKDLPGRSGAAGRSKIVTMREVQATGYEGKNIKPLFERNLMSMGRGELNDQELLNYGNLSNIFFNADLVKQFDEQGFQELTLTLQKIAKDPGKLGELELRIGLGSSRGENFSLRIPGYLNYIVYLLKHLSERQEQTLGSFDKSSLPQVVIYSAANMVAEVNADDPSTFLASRDYMFDILRKFLDQSLGSVLCKNISFINDKPSSSYSGEFSDFLLKGSEKMLRCIQSELSDDISDGPMGSIIKTIQRKQGMKNNLSDFLPQLNPEDLIYSFAHAVYSQDVQCLNSNFESVLDMKNPTSGKILMIGGPSEIPYQALRNFVGGESIGNTNQTSSIKVITNVDKLPPYLEPPYEDITLQTLEQGLPFERIKRKKMFAKELSSALEFTPGANEIEKWKNYISIFS